MRVLPGDLVSATAGAILRRGAPVRHADPEMDKFVGSALCVTDPGPDHFGRDSVQVLDNNAEFRDYATSMVGLDLDDPAGMDLAARWLAMHYGLTVGPTAPEWHESWGDGSRWTLTGDRRDYRHFVDPAKDRRESSIPAPGFPTTDPVDALIAACLAAGARP